MSCVQCVALFVGVITLVAIITFSAIRSILLQVSV